ncbi:ABC transporter permease [candidate division KSB1 bacterium]
MKNRFKKTPFFGALILKFFLPRSDREFLLEDFKKVYNEKRKSRGKLSAWLWFWGQVLKTAPGFIFYLISRSFDMYKNYLKTALRNIKRQKGYSFINIGGLAVGMACFILIGSWVQDEFSYDKFNTNYNEIYRIISKETYEGVTEHATITPGAFAPAFKEEIPEISSAARLRRYGGSLKYNDRSFQEDDVYFADNDIFNILTFEFIKGSSSNALKEPLSIVMTESMAAKYFMENEDPVGKVLNLNNLYNFTVTGVVKDLPRNSSVKFDFLIPALHSPEFMDFENALTSWTLGAWSTFILVDKNTGSTGINQKIKELRSRNTSESNSEIYLQPLKDIHFYSRSQGGIYLSDTSSIKYVYIFSTAAAFIILIACINFMNLTTARYGRRCREIGFRKVAGAYRSDLIIQFLSEAVILAMTALVFALIIAAVFLPAFNSLSGKEISLNINGNELFYVLILSIAVLTGLISGSYPAFFLSRFQPVDIIKDSIKTGSKNSLFRKTLVVTQFSISILLIVCALTVSGQLSFIRNKDLGINKDQVLYLRNRGEIAQKYETIKNELGKNPIITGISRVSNLPSRGIWATLGVEWEGKSTAEQVVMEFVSVDYGYSELFNIELLEGRNFSEKHSDSDQNRYILNEEAVKLMGMEFPLDKKFYIGDGFNEGPIIGITKNFHFESLHSEIKPLVMVMFPTRYRYILIKVKPENLNRTISFIENKFSELIPSAQFEYHFLNESFEDLYKSEKQLGTIFNYFTGLAVIISCLGLFGLVSYMAQTRKKEIGIRKVLGASIPGILSLLTKEFVLLVALGNIIAWPLSYYFMNRWLQSFAYRSDLTVTVFLFSGCLAFIIALLTVGYQALKAASANPVESLRNE